MSDAPVPSATPSIRNLPAWAMERFGPDHWVMFFVLWATALVTGRFLAGGNYDQVPRAPGPAPPLCPAT